MKDIHKDVSVHRLVSVRVAPTAHFDVSISSMKGLVVSGIVNTGAVEKRVTTRYGLLHYDYLIRRTGPFISFQPT